MKPIFTQIQSW